MSAAVINLLAARRARREAQARAEHGLPPDSTFLPIGVIGQRLIENLRLRRLEAQQEKERA